MKSYLFFRHTDLLLQIQMFILNFEIKIGQLFNGQRNIFKMQVIISRISRNHLDRWDSYSNLPEIDTDMDRLPNNLYNLMCNKNVCVSVKILSG